MTDNNVNVEITPPPPVPGPPGSPVRELRKAYLVAGLVLLVVIAGVALLLAVSGGGDDGPSGPGVYTDPSRTIRLETGDEFTIELESNPSTGFSWVLTEQLDTRVVRMAGASYRPPDPPLPGAPGTDVWTFRANGPGKAEITLGYQKSSVSPTEQAGEVTFTVEVK